MVLVFSFYFKSCSEAGMQVTRAPNFLSLVLTVLTWLASNLMYGRGWPLAHRDVCVCSYICCHHSQPKHYFLKFARISNFEVYSVNMMLSFDNQM